MQCAGARETVTYTDVHNIAILLEKINHLAVKEGAVLPHTIDGPIFAVNNGLVQTCKLLGKCLEAIPEQPGSIQIVTTWRVQKGDQFLWDLSHSHPMGHYEPVCHFATLLRTTSFTDHSGFHAPEQQIKLIERNADSLREAYEASLEREILPVRKRLRHRSDGSVSLQVPQDVAVEDRKSSVEANVAKKMCRLFVTNPHDILHKPFAPGRRIRVLRHSLQDNWKVILQLYKMLRLCFMKPDVRTAISQDGLRVDRMTMEGESLKFFHNLSGAFCAGLWGEKAVHQFVKVF